MADVRLPEWIINALALFGQVTADHTHVCLIGPPCNAVNDLRRAIAAEIRLACARGAERTADMTYEECQRFATKLRKEAATLEAGGGEK